MKEKKRKKDEQADWGVAPRVCKQKDTPCTDSKRGGPQVFVSERGFQCTCEERERSAGKKKRAKDETGASTLRTCPRVRHEAMSRHIPGPGREGRVSQSEGGRRTRRVTEEAWGRGTQGATRHVAKGQAGGRHEKKGKSVNKKEKDKRKRTRWLQCCTLCL